MKKVTVTKAAATKLLAGSGTKKLIIECRDSENSIARLINYMGEIGNGGHSFGIIVDPDMKEYTKNFGWDGDGSDSIISISEINEETGKPNKLEFDDEGNVKRG